MATTLNPKLLHLRPEAEQRHWTASISSIVKLMARSGRSLSSASRTSSATATEGGASMEGGCCLLESDSSPSEREGTCAQLSAIINGLCVRRQYGRFEDEGGYVCSLRLRLRVD